MASRSRKNSMLVGPQDANNMVVSTAQGFSYNANTISTTVTLPAGVNAMYVGKLTIGSTGKVVVPEGTRLVVV